MGTDTSLSLSIYTSTSQKPWPHGASRHRSRATPHLWAPTGIHDAMAPVTDGSIFLCLHWVITGLAQWRMYWRPRVWSCFLHSTIIWPSVCPGFTDGFSLNFLAGETEKERLFQIVNMCQYEWSLVDWSDLTVEMLICNSNESRIYWNLTQIIMARMNRVYLWVSLNHPTSTASGSLSMSAAFLHLWNVSLPFVLQTPTRIGSYHSYPPSQNLRVHRAESMALQKQNLVVDHHFIISHIGTAVIGYFSPSDTQINITLLVHGGYFPITSIHGEFDGWSPNVDSCIPISHD